MTKKSKKALEKRGIQPKVEKADKKPVKLAKELTEMAAKLIEDNGGGGVLIVAVDATGSMFANVRASNHGELLLLEKMAKREINRIFEATAFAPVAPAPSEAEKPSVQ